MLHKIYLIVAKTEVEKMEFAMKVIGFFGLVIIITAITALPVKWLWNWLMPAIFGLPAISVWKAFGLVLLSRIFFERHIDNGE